MPKETLHLNKPQKERNVVRNDDGLPITARMKQTFKFVYVHYPKNWLFCEERGFLPDVMKVVARPGLNGVRRDGSMTVALARVQEKGGQYLDPKDSRLGDYQDYVHFYPKRGGGKYYVDFNKAATVLPNDEIIWNKSEQQALWYDFLQHVRDAGLIRPMLKEIYIGMRELEQKRHDSLFARVERNPHLAVRLKRSEARIQGMDEEWRKMSESYASGAASMTPSRGVERGKE